jgi:hypothetical protein
MTGNDREVTPYLYLLDNFDITHKYFVGLNDLKKQYPLTHERKTDRLMMTLRMVLPGFRGKNGGFSVDNRRRLLFALSIIAVLTASCGDSSQNQTPLQSDKDQGFTFFSVGPETLFSDHLKVALGKNLGSAAVESMNVIDLTIRQPDFLDRNFPDVGRMNRELNGESGQRVEHDTRRLIFRYLPASASPFRYAEWMFSGMSLKPLYCKIRAQRGGETLEGILTERYGRPSEIFCGNEPNRCLFWEHSGDLLILSIKENRRGEMEYEIMIYYLKHLEELIASEKAEKVRLEKERRKALEKAF